MKKKLTIQQQKFVDNKLMNPDWSDAKCYQNAYPKVKNENTAKAAASRLLTNVNVRAYMDKVQREAERKSELSLAKVLSRWNDIIDFDVRKLFDNDNKIKNVKDLDDKTTAAISGVKVDGDKVEVKTINIKGVLTDAARHFGLFDKDNQQRNIQFEDLLDALPEDFRNEVRKELRIILSQKRKKS